MRFFIAALLLPVVLTAPAFAKMKARQRPAPSNFSGELLSYQQLVELPKAKRAKYLAQMVELLATMESFNNQYSVAELEKMQQLREQIASLMQMVSFLPEAHADVDEFEDTPPPVDVSRIIAAHNGVEWTCGRGAHFDSVLGSCVVTNSGGLTAFVPSSTQAAEAEHCPAGTKEVPHYRPNAVACVPNASWSLLPAQRQAAIVEKKFESPRVFRGMSLEQQRLAIMGSGAGSAGSARPAGEPEAGPGAAAPAGAATTPAGRPAGGTPGAATAPSNTPGGVAAAQSPRAEPAAPAAPPAPAEPEARAGAGTSEPQRNPTCEPAPSSCKNLSAADRTSAINRFRATAKYQGVDANICIAGGFASKYSSAQKKPSTCQIKRSLQPGKAKETCKADEALCNPVLFCVATKKDGVLRPGSICAKRTGDRKNRPLTDTCAAEYQKIIKKEKPLVGNLMGEACDPTKFNFGSEFKKIWDDLIAQTKNLRDVWCGKSDFAALFCRECEIVNDKIYAMNKEATGSGCPEVRAPARTPAPSAAPPAPASPGSSDGIREGDIPQTGRPDGRY